MKQCVGEIFFSDQRLRAAASPVAEAHDGVAAVKFDGDYQSVEVTLLASLFSLSTFLLTSSLFFDLLCVCLRWRHSVCLCVGL